MQSASTSFDASVWELFAPLTTGARMSIVRDSVDLDALVQTMRNAKATVLQWVPSLLRVLIDHPELSGASKSLRLLFCGGEPFESSLRDSVVRITNAVPVNLYGPPSARSTRRSRNAGQVRSRSGVRLRTRVCTS